LTSVARECCVKPPLSGRRFYCNRYLNIPRTERVSLLPMAYRTFLSNRPLVTIS